MEKTDIIETVLKVIPDLDQSEAETLVEVADQRKAQAGAILLSQGDRGSELFLLLNGEFSVFYKARANLQSVAMHQTHFPGPGLLGEVNLILEAERTATVVSRTECDYLFFDKSSYDGIVLEHPRVAIKIVTKIASILQNRFENQRRTMYHNLIKDSSSPIVGVKRISHWLGYGGQISDTLSDRLFKDYDGENFNS